MGELKPFQILSAIVVLGGTVSVINNYSRQYAWAFVFIVLLSMVTTTAGAPERFAAALNGVRKLTLGGP